MESSKLRCKVTKLIKSEPQENQTRLDELILPQDIKGKEFADSMESLWNLNVQD